MNEDENEDNNEIYKRLRDYAYRIGDHPPSYLPEPGSLFRLRRDPLDFIGDSNKMPSLNVISYQWIIDPYEYEPLPQNVTYNGSPHLKKVNMDNFERVGIQEDDVLMFLRMEKVPDDHPEYFEELGVEAIPLLREKRKYVFLFLVKEKVVALDIFKLDSLERIE